MRMCMIFLVGFLKKVYGIVSVQLLATVLISLLVMFSNPIRGFVLTAAYPVMLCMLGSVVTFFLLLSYRTIHPTNMYLLATFVSDDLPPALPLTSFAVSDCFLGERVDDHLLSYLFLPFLMRNS